MSEQLPSETNVDALDNFADPNLDAYLEGFGDALDSAAITCARCASLERRIAELERHNATLERSNARLRAKLGLRWRVDR